MNGCFFLKWQVVVLIFGNQMSYLQENWVQFIKRCASGSTKMTVMSLLRYSRWPPWCYMRWKSIFIIFWYICLFVFSVIFLLGHRWTCDCQYFRFERRAWAGKGKLNNLFIFGGTAQKIMNHLWLSHFFRWSMFLLTRQELWQKMKCSSENVPLLASNMWWVMCRCCVLVP